MEEWNQKPCLNPFPDRFTILLRMSMKTIQSLLISFAALSLPFSAACDHHIQHPTGYTDTPKLPHSKWRIHDDDRPRPEVVEPGKTNRDAPSDAIVLFDGTGLDQWERKGGGKIGWKIDGKTLEIVPKTGDIVTKKKFGDCQLHLEWRPNYPPVSNSQHRSNSGVFFFDRYEIQILDCYDNKTYADGHAGAIYGQYPPLVNANRPPNQWQTYDIVFVAPRFDEDGGVVSPAMATVFMNGILVQHASELIGDTTHKTPGSYKAHPPTGPIRLQDHRDQPIQFRNIWIRNLNLKRD